MARKKQYDIGFIGGGNMAEALIKGLVGADQPPSRVLVAEPLAGKRRALARRYGIKTTTDNGEVAGACQTVVLAVKPQIMGEVLEGISAVVGKSQLVVSIAAGIKIARLEKGLGGNVRVVRVMPNTPCLVGRGMSVLCGGRWARGADLARARRLFATVGEAIVTPDEALLDPVTGLSGSGPAYVYLFAEGLIRGGVAAGLSEEVARKLTYQTIAGAAEMLQGTGESPQALREAVSSPGGTTVAGLGRLRSGRFVPTVAAAVRTATKRSKELGRS